MPGCKPLCGCAPQTESRGRCRVSPSMLPLLSLAPKQDAASCFSFSQFIWYPGSLGGASLSSSVSISMTPVPLSLAPMSPF